MMYAEVFNGPCRLRRASSLCHSLFTTGYRAKPFTSIVKHGWCHLPTLHPEATGSPGLCAQPAAVLATLCPNELRKEFQITTSGTSGLKSAVPFGTRVGPGA